MAIFKCPKCKKEINCSKYRMFYRNNRTILIDLSSNKEIICPKCKTPMILKKEIGNFESSGFGSFSSLDPLQKQLELRKRSREDAKKQKYVENEKELSHYNG